MSPDRVAPMHISIIIPAYNEAARIAGALACAEAARRRYREGAGRVEIIVVDNHSSDATRTIAERFACRIVSEAVRVIAAVRNAGARQAHGEILLFIDADNRLHPETLNAVAAAMQSGRWIGGATGVRMERMSAGIAVTLALFMPFVWLTGMDTGAVFCRRDDFMRIGGYDPRLRYAEDVDFLWRLKKAGRRRKLALTRLRPVKAVFSTRKFDRYGDWHYLELGTRFLFSQVFGSAAMDRFADRYWYRRV